jgi:filamentous hemagglutinin family protein
MKHRSCSNRVGAPAHLLVVAALAWPLAAGAGALTDGSVGPVQTLSGAFSVPQALGSVRGANLFHSFTRFGIERGESATFSTSDTGIRHVISRVTGSEASNFNGLLTLSATGGGSPSFWFVNPNGIVVGDGAAFNVPGSLHLGSATQLRLADGQVWEARGSGSSLSVAAPESFGFVGPQAAAALRWQGANLTLQPGSTLELAGASLSLQRAQLSAPGGRMRLQSPGAIDLSDGVQLHASTSAVPGSGNIRIDAGVLTLDASQGPAQLLVETEIGQVAAADAIELNVAGALQLRAGADVTAVSASRSAAGRVHVVADTMTVDGLGLQATGFGSYATNLGAGPDIDIDVAGRVALSNGGQLFTYTLGSGDGGRLKLRAGSLALEGQGNFAFIGTQTSTGPTGNAGALTLQLRDALTMTQGGLITTQSAGSGGAGRFELSAGSVRIDGQGGTGFTGLQSIGAAPMRVDVAGALELFNGGAIETVSIAAQASSELLVRAGSARLDGGGVGGSQIGSRSSNDSPAAALRVEVVDRLALERGGQINSVSLGRGDAGAVGVKAATIEMTGGGDFVTQIASSALQPQSGHSGDVTVQARQLTLASNANIYADSFSDQGNAGRVTIAADSVVLDGRGLATGIRSHNWGQDGAAGTVQVTAKDLTVRDGASLTAGTFGNGRSGSIRVSASTLLIDGKEANQSFTGIAGDALLGLGTGAEVQVDATQITLRNGGSITSSTFSSADAGSVRVSADRISIDGGDRRSSTGISADSGGAGRAGNLSIKTIELALANEALISSSSLASGDGGSITIDATRLSIDGGAGVFTVAGGSGAAGNIDLRVSDALSLRQGGSLSANTGGSGAAGRISISAGSFLASGSDPQSGFKSLVISRARPGSGGQPGSIALDVRGALELQDGAALSIANDAQVRNPALIQPTTLSVQAGQMRLSDSDITAAASANAGAGRIALATSGNLLLDRSSVRTSALDGDGGPITVDVGGTMRLRDSRITTSVEGRSNGNGGDIALAAQALLLESGFIQANSSAPLARGGDVRIEVRTLLPNGSQVFVGGNRVQDFRRGVPGFNVIQAAAPDGVSGTLDVTLPQLNLSGTLAGLQTRRVDFGPLSRDVCEVGADSSLGLQGRGALSVPASAPLSLQP